MKKFFLFYVIQNLFMYSKLVCVFITFVQEINDRLTNQEDRNSDLQRSKKKLEIDLDGLNKKIQDLELSLKKSESEKITKDNQIRSLQEEMTNQDEFIGRLNKEKKHQEEVSRKLVEDLQGEEDKVNHLNKIKLKLEQQLDDVIMIRMCTVLSYCTC